MEEEKGCCGGSCGCGSFSFFPKCPKCGEGDLLPFSYKEDVFEKWKCSKCEHTIQKRENR